MSITAILENIRVALVGLRMNKLRAALTMLGITIGVAAVIILISAGQAVADYITDQFNSIGSNLMFAIAMPDDKGTIQPFTMKEVEALSDTLYAPDVTNVMPQLAVNQPVVNEGTQISVQTQGVTPEYLTLLNRQVVNGRFFSAAEVDTQARVAVVGQEVVDRLFEGESPVNRNIRIGSVRFQVIGVLNAAGNSDSDLTILIPITTAQTRLSGERVLTGERPVSAIMMQARDSERVDAAEEQIADTLRRTREVKIGEEDNFMVISQEMVLNILTGIISLFTVFMGVVAGISLLVGGIGVMNIMLVTVTERTREIGLRKAVGARSQDIVFQFLIESVVLTMVGGAIGILISAVVAVIVGRLVPDVRVGVQFSSVILATAISGGVGIFFGIYPARRAAALNPIDALRYE